MTRWLFYLRKNLVVCVCRTEPLLQLAVATGAPWNCSIVASLWDEMKEIIEGKKNLLTYKTTLYLDWRCNIEEVPVNKKYLMICWLRPNIDLNFFFLHIFQNILISRFRVDEIMINASIREQLRKCNFDKPLIGFFG